jgi:protein-tyrosine kinase
MSTVIRKRKATPSPAPIGRGRVDPRADTLLGRLLLDAGKLTEIDVGRVVATQRQQNLRFGEAAEQLGLVSSEDVRWALARQFGYPYLPKDSPLDAALVAAFQPLSAQAEALRELRSQLLLRWFDDRRKTLAVISPRANEGCSHLAANLAVVFAQLGERTLLVDANFRNPMQHELFGLNPAVGLSGVLAGRCELDDALSSIAPFDKLTVLCAGARPPNPQELLSRVVFRYVLETAPAGFDAVIIDTPPLLDYADAQIIAAIAGGCLLATHRHKTRLADVERVKAKIEPTRAVLLGAALIG